MFLNKLILTCIVLSFLTYDRRMYSTSISLNYIYVFKCSSIIIFIFNIFDYSLMDALFLVVRCVQYVVVSSKKILFYNDEQDKEQSNPCMVLDIE